MTKYKIHFRLLLIFMFMFLGLNASLANGGPSIMYFLGYLKLGELLIGNFFIGIFESEFIRRTMKIGNRVWIIVIANYLSAIGGLYLSNLLLDTSIIDVQTNQMTLDSINRILWIYLLSFVITLIIEMPFYWFSLKEKVNKLNFMKIVFVTNFVSYLIISMVYVLLNTTSNWTTY